MYKIALKMDFLTPVKFRRQVSQMCE